MTKRPIVAFLYDFDKTLCTTDMEDYAFIPVPRLHALGVLDKANGFGHENQMDGLLAYMYTMIRECRRAGHPSRPRLSGPLRAKPSSYFPACASGSRASPPTARTSAWTWSITSSPPVCGRSSRAAASPMNSGRSTPASSFTTEGLATWPKLDVNFTNKTQFVYRINKGVLDVSDDKTLNDSMPDDSKRIPFTNMIYVGDGLSDVPCMKMMRAYGGQAIAVYQASNRAGVEDLLSKGRVDFIFPADYREGTGLDSTVKNIIRKMAISDALPPKNAQQLQAIGWGDLPEQVGLFE